MNICTYHDKALLEGPQNSFKLTTGVAPSFGFFRMRAEDVEYVLTTQNGAPGTLVLSDGTNTVTLYNIYLVRSTSVSAIEDVVCDVVLADERILWQYKYGTADYNTYKTDRVVGTAEFDLENLSPDEDEWTFDELITALKTILDITTLTLNSPLRKPRNIIGKNVPGPCIFQQLLIALQSYVTVDLQVTPPTYVIYPVGDAEQAGDLALLTTYSGYLHKGSTVRINPLVQKGLAVKMLASADPDAITSDPGRLLTYGSKTATGGSAGSNRLIPSMYAVFGNEENAVDLGTIGDAVAQEYVDSFQNTWRDNLYAGILPVKLNRAIHVIQWSSNAQGAFTHVKSFRPREELNGKDLQDLLFSYHRYLLGAGKGGTEVRSAQIQTGGVPSDSTGPFTCKLLDSEGNETGDDIEVYPRKHLGTNNFDSTDIHPDYADADKVPVYKDLDGKWYTQNVFEDTIDCVRTEP